MESTWSRYLRTYNWERFPNRKLNIAVICQAQYQGEVEKFLNKLLNGINGNGSFTKRFRLDAPNIQVFKALEATPDAYKKACIESIEHATDLGEQCHLVLIQIDEFFHNLNGDENSYLTTKAFFLSRNIPVQQFEIETITQNEKSLIFTINNIGVACYAKVGGTPWIIPAHQLISHELVIGIGSHVAKKLSRFGADSKYVGVTTIFSSSGRYILESKTKATPIAEYFDELLNSIKYAIQEIRTRDNWGENERVRLIFHIFKPLKNIEIDTIKDLVRILKITYIDFSFITLNGSHPYLLIDKNQSGVGNSNYKKGIYVPQRGFTVKISDNEILMQLTGAKELKTWTDSQPKPILINLHHESTFKDIDYLSKQIFDFSCLSWRSLLLSPLPITILYSRLIARNIELLESVTNWSADDTIGPIGRTRWFL